MGDIRESAVLRALAERFARTQAGRTGKAARDFIVDYQRLLNEAGCAEGEERVCAVGDLEALDGDILIIERHRLGNPETIRFPIENEARLFSLLGMDSPGQSRERLAECFREARGLSVPGDWSAGWDSFCQKLADDALHGAPVVPFDRGDLEQTREILALLPALLEWTCSEGASRSQGGVNSAEATTLSQKRGESLMRFASSYLCGDSKRLEQLRSKLEACLGIITGGAIRTLADLGITANERSLLIHGPLRMAFDDGSVDLGLFAGPLRVSATDLERATFQTEAARCLTVENAAMLHEICKLGSGIILASSGSEGGFANSAVIAFLKKLPDSVECWHFGDSDPKGFDILRDLRERTGRQIGSLHMRYRGSHRGSPEASGSVLEITAVPQLRDRPISQKRSRDCGTSTTMLSREDAKGIERLLASEFLTPEEKAELQKIKAAGDLGQFEQESLGLPKREWPFY
jgi:hypothetical protein